MSNLETLPQTLKDRLELLPSSIRDLYTFDTVDVIISNAAKEFDLTEEQASLLKIEVDLIISLFESRDDLIDRLINEFGFEEVKAINIKQFLDDNLFIIIEQILEAADTERILNEVENLNMVSEGMASTNTTFHTERPTITETLPSSETDVTVKPLRTFSQDVDISRAHSYGAFKGSDNKPDNPTDEPIISSSQDDIIKQ